MISFLFVMFSSFLAGNIFQKQIQLIEAGKDKNNNAVEINWEELYPYKTVVEQVQEEIVTSGNKTEETNSRFDELISRIKKLETIGNRWAQRMYGYSEIAKVGYVIDAMLTDPSVGTTYIKLKNGYWITQNDKTSESYINTCVAPYATLQNYLKEKGIDFLYFYSPNKVCQYVVEIPDGVSFENNANANINTGLRLMDKYGINYVDMRENLHKDYSDHYSLYYKTDHHWTINSGLWASSVLVHEINNRFNMTMIDPQDIGQYSSKTFGDIELGSMGRGVTKFVADPEDFSVLFPSFETNYRLEIPNLQVDEQGSFEDVFIDYEGLNEVIASGGGSAYGKVLYGNQPYEKITNYNNPNGPKILMLRDSIAIAVAPYLAGSCSELVLLDTRPSNGNFNGSVISCIDEFDPDIVLVLQTSVLNLKINKDN